MLQLTSADRDAAVQSMMEALQDGRECLHIEVDAPAAAELPQEDLTALFKAAVYNDCCDLPVYPSGFQITVESGPDGAYSTAFSLLFDGITEAEYSACRKEYLALLDRYAKDLENLGEAPEKLYRTVYYLVCRHTAFDEELARQTLGHESETRNGAALAERGAYGALVSGKSICTGYAMLYKALCDRLGLPCWVVVGETPEGTHAWNVVLVDGELRYVDTAEGDRGSRTEDDCCLMREIRYLGLERDAKDYFIPSFFTEAHK